MPGAAGYSLQSAMREILVPAPLLVPIYRAFRLVGPEVGRFPVGEMVRGSLNLRATGNSGKPQNWSSGLEYLLGIFGCANRKAAERGQMNGEPIKEHHLFIGPDHAVGIFS